MNIKLLENNFEFGKVSLRVSNLENSIKFYQEKLGLKLIQKDETQAELGIDKKVFLNLEYNPLYEKAKYLYNGLFHIAYLLPNEEALGSLINHLSDMKDITLSVSDHGYSQALYFSDPDGHGIEVYADKPVEVWPVDHEHKIKGYTVSANIDRLKEIGKKQIYQTMPEKTKIGHLHLRVNNLELHKLFYIHQLGMDLQDDDTRSVFLSVNGYHHHIAANNWRSPIGVLPDEALGMNYYTLKVDNIEAFRNEFKHLSEYKEENNILEITDPSGIKIKIEKR